MCNRINKEASLILLFITSTAATATNTYNADIDADADANNNNNNPSYYAHDEHEHDDSKNIKHNNKSSTATATSSNSLSSSSSKSPPLHLYQSYIESIICQNIMRSSTSSSPTNSNKISIHLTNQNDENNPTNSNSRFNNGIGMPGPNLVTVTGETGTGKSLLVFKTIQLILGEKVSSNIMVRNSNFASSEIIIKLSEPHLSYTKRMMDSFGLDSSTLFFHNHDHDHDNDKDNDIEKDIDNHVDIDIDNNNNNNNNINNNINNNKDSKDDDRITCTNEHEHKIGELKLKRTIHKSTINNRLKSKCEINGQQVTLKTLRSIAKQLITTVDASTASNALSQGKARMAIIDMGVPYSIVQQVKLAKTIYRHARISREGMEREIENRIMPASFTSLSSMTYNDDGSSSSSSDSDNSSDVNDKNVELLQHWIDELDSFKTRIDTFQDSILSFSGTMELLQNYRSTFEDDDDDDHHDHDEDENDHHDDYYSKNNFSNNEEISFVEVLDKFSKCSWDQDASTSSSSSSSSSSSINKLVYSNLLDLRDGIKHLDQQLASAQASCDALSSLSTSQSVASALEQSRNHLFDATVGCEKNEILSNAAETSHELLNQLEDALKACTRFMADDPNGILSNLEKVRQSVVISVEDIDFLLADWGSISRKHGIMQFSLPSLHRSLREELDGNVEARLMLPKAIEKEKLALVEFEKACTVLSHERRKVCISLTQSVTSRMKDLGMEGSSLNVKLNAGIWKCTDSSAYTDGGVLGIDSVDFLLLHDKNVNERPNGEMSKEGINDSIGGKLELVGSSGEKARLLLAIETDLPGSVGKSCNSITSINILDSAEEIPGPIAVIYDEIDAHVGGRAAVSLAKLLVDQTRFKKGVPIDEAKRSQIISITHSPSLAAIADHHIVMQKGQRGKDEVLVHSVKGLGRLQEIARMASGDLAIEESIRFAEALLRDGLKYKQTLA